MDRVIDARRFPGVHSDAYLLLYFTDESEKSVDGQWTDGNEGRRGDGRGRWEFAGEFKFVVATWQWVYASFTATTYETKDND
ncbi:hypothetical protein CBR_g22470 [Chara braunii]|uniref:Uncharacterized protein n=1 Tax=Chara braunii TaxID=69332 RepID=A0A388L2R1_CHABU|nr:hypothetical protein CBR_g22470 [Chara braunii]|eukprot:GBG76591.1 hypothetical protein CBR_g22470 [Chara braunii]